MEKKIIVKTEQGKPNSLKKPVKIAFTITPDEFVAGPSHPYSPVSPFIQTFSANSEESTTVTQCSKSTACLYESRWWGYWTEGSKFPLDPGQGVTLRSSTNWDYAGQRTSALIVNRSGAPQRIIMGLPNFHLAYQPLENDCSIRLPSSWKLQAYEVDDEVTDRTLLQPNHLSRPIFPTTILWDRLPAESTWILSEENNGTVRIHNDRYSPVVRVAQPASRKDPLSEILERLTSMEKSINRIQDDVIAGQKTMDNIQNRLSTLETTTMEESQKSRARIAAMEARTAGFTDSFVESHGHLTARVTVTDTQQVLGMVKKSTSDQLQDIRQRLPLVESKADTSLTRIFTLEGLTGQIQDQVTAGEKPVHQTQEQVSPLAHQTAPTKQSSGGSASSSQGQTVEQDERILIVEAKVERLAQEQRKTARVIERRMPIVEARADKLEAALGVVQVSVTGLDRRVGVIEASSGDEEAGAAFPWVENSPIVFPNHPVDGPPQSPSSSH